MYFKKFLPFFFFVKSFFYFLLEEEKIVKTQCLSLPLWQDQPLRDHRPAEKPGFFRHEGNLYIYIGTIVGSRQKEPSCGCGSRPGAGVAPCEGGGLMLMLDVLGLAGVLPAYPPLSPWLWFWQQAGY